MCSVDTVFSRNVFSHFHISSHHTTHYHHVAMPGCDMVSAVTIQELIKRSSLCLFALWLDVYYIAYNCRTVCLFFFRFFFFRFFADWDSHGISVSKLIANHTHKCAVYIRAFTIALYSYCSVCEENIIYAIVFWTVFLRLRFFAAFGATT